MSIRVIAATVAAAVGLAIATCGPANDAAVASDDFVNTGPTRDFGQEVYQFKILGAATAIFNGLHAIARRCP